MTQIVNKPMSEKSRRHFLIGTVGGSLLMAFAPTLRAMEVITGSVSER
jgi:hypothetical protein